MSRHHSCSFWIFFAGWLSLGGGLSLPTECLAQSVQIHDKRLQLTLFASDPEIVTPIGMAIDAEDRLFVIESHTHLPPHNYDGPAHDRIKVFRDDDDDGRPEHISVFADGISQAMNLAFSPTGDLYVVCARQVLRLRDIDQDGDADEQTRILQLETTERYAHNSLLGITFDAEGTLYVARGNTGSRQYAVRGTDGSVVEGYGDGGSVIRCNADGSEVEEFATGFWNPFDLKFDHHGHLLLVDNDPDARGPNRLLHVVPGGDYGYQSLYGGSGNHPFQGWDGSLPGTLPYIAGTGEAPSGLIDLTRSAFPKDYQQCVLSTIWNENSIERFALQWTPRGVSATKTRFMSGPKDFRPVALACDSRGNLFITDWVLVDYPNHGRGRIWRVHHGSDGARLSPRSSFDRLPDPVFDSSRSEPMNASRLRSSLLDPNPYARHAAIMELQKPAWDALRRRLASDVRPELRLASLLAYAGDETRMDIDLLRAFLQDPHEPVRLAALKYTAETFDSRLRPELATALTGSNVTASVFEAWLAATACLEPAYARQVLERRREKSNSIPRPISSQILWQVAMRDDLSPTVRSLAIARLDDDSAVAHAATLLALLAAEEDQLRVATLQRLGRIPTLLRRPHVVLAFVRAATDHQQSSSVRCAALEALANAEEVPPETLTALWKDSDTEVALAAADLFRAYSDVREIRTQLQAALSSSTTDLRPEIEEPLLYALHGDDPEKNRFAVERPQSEEHWRRVLAEGGNPRRGRRVFLSNRVGCSKCHTLNGVGNPLGPDLSRIAQSKTRPQIIDAILDPSAEFPPQYQAWLVLTEDGQIHRGLQLDHKQGGAIVLDTEDGQRVRFEAEDIADYRASPTSLMPQRLYDAMSVTEFRDLVAFLASRK